MATYEKIYTAKDKRSNKYIDWVEAGRPNENKPVASGKWEATVRMNGYKDVSQRFKVKIRAEEWVSDTEAAMRDGTYDDVVKTASMTFKEVAEQYLVAVAVHKDGYNMELDIVPLFYMHSFSNMLMSNIKPAHIEAYRDDSLDSGLVGDTVIRRMNTLTAIWNYAIENLNLKVRNVIKPVKRPAAGDHRTRQFEDDEEERLLSAAERYGAGCGLLRPVIEFALETTMRRGEIVGIDSKRLVDGELDARGRKKRVTYRRHDGLSWGMVKLDKKVVSLTKKITKNGSARDVPLSPKAIEILKEQQARLGRSPKASEKVFSISPDGVRNSFQKARKFAGIEGFRFHDLRHVGCTRWSKHLSQLQLMRLTGHKDPRMLARYYNEESSEVADVMAAAVEQIEAVKK